MQNKGLSVFVVFLISVASVFFSSNFFASFNPNAQYEYQGQVVAITETGIELEHDGAISSVELSDEKKGQLYVLETVAISDGDVYPIANSSAGYYENNQIITSSGIVQSIAAAMVTIDDLTYQYDHGNVTFDVDDNVYFEFYENQDGSSIVLNVYPNDEFIDLRVETIGRNSDGCMVLNNQYVINADTDLNVDIMTIAVLDNCQISVDGNNDISVLRYVA